MTERYPATPATAFPKTLKQLGADVQRLKTVTAALEPGCLVTPYLGTIPPGYTSGHPTVTLPNGTVLGPLQYADTYTPHAGDTVLCVPVGQTYIIIAAVV